MSTSTPRPAWGTGVQDPDHEVRTALRLVCDAIKRQGLSPETAALRREAVRLAHQGGLSRHVIHTVTGLDPVTIARILEGTN